jgi:4-diphosphocytidyl-2-C-methyl-D-erythritol kinase
MENTILTAHAKINLSLNLFPQRGKGGYYKVRFLNTQVTLSDTVIISKTADKSILINEPRIDESENIAYRAAQLMFRHFNLSGGVSISIKKHIPLKAGLGGGSCDAGAVINGISKLFGLVISESQKLSLAEKLGMDVCYCSIGGLCMIEGVGQVVKKLPLMLPRLNLLISTPRTKKPSTEWAYSVVNEREIGKKIEKLDSLIKGIRNRDVEMIASNIHNDFERTVKSRYPIVSTIKRKMISHGALNSMMAGSGLSVFGIFIDEEGTLRAKNEIECMGHICHIVHTVT